MRGICRRGSQKKMIYLISIVIDILEPHKPGFNLKTIWVRLRNLQNTQGKIQALVKFG